jgi:hypothetical protein
VEKFETSQRRTNLAEKCHEDIDMTPTPVRSLAAISIAATSIAATLMVASDVAVATGAGAPSAGGATSTQSAPAPQKQSHAKKNNSSLEAAYALIYGVLVGFLVALYSGVPVVQFVTRGL